MPAINDAIDRPTSTPVRNRAVESVCAGQVVSAMMKPGSDTSIGYIHLGSGRLCVDML